MGAERDVRSEHLCCIEESESSHFLGSFGDVDVRADNGGVVSAAVPRRDQSSDVHVQSRDGTAYHSRVTLFSVLLALSITFLPVTVDPVK